VFTIVPDWTTATIFDSVKNIVMQNDFGLISSPIPFDTSIKHILIAVMRDTPRLRFALMVVIQPFVVGGSIKKFFDLALSEPIH
jgi:hypothetical protein